MKILSVHWGTCSTASLVVDGHVLACVSEERFSRRKNDEAYPRHAIEAVLATGGVAPKDLDVVVFAGLRFDAKAVLCRKYSGFRREDRLREEREYWYPRLYEKKDVAYLDVFKDKVDVEQYPGSWDAVLAFMRGENGTEQENAFYQDFRRQVICRHLGVEPVKVRFAHHHRSHGYYAYYASPLEKDRVLVLTADGWGDDMNASVSVSEGREIRVLQTAANFQVGRLYRSMTLLLGMKPDEHEYKVMGLAPYASFEHYKDTLAVFRETQHVDGLGFAYDVKPPDLYVYFRERLEGFRFDTIAGAIQQYAEEILVEWVRNGLKASGARRAVFGGGVGMNVKAMMQVAKLPELDDLFIAPTPSDESLAIGAAYVVEHDSLLAQGRDPRDVLRALPNAYLGPEASAAATRDAVRAFSGDARFRVSERADAAYIAGLLARGRIVGRCVGRSEFGARALGNRSILADARDPRVVKKINEKVKSRDFWMPFAPAIKAERAGDYLVNPKGLRAPYMTLAFETSERAQRDLIAALHPADLTARPQVVSRQENPAFHGILGAFEETTGAGGVLNTSFNLHGEPIVQTPAEAVRVFRVSGLDALVLDGVVIEKTDG